MRTECAVNTGDKVRSERAVEARSECAVDSVTKARSELAVDSVTEARAGDKARSECAVDESRSERAFNTGDKARAVEACSECAVGSVTKVRCESAVDSVTEAHW